MGEKAKIVKAQKGVQVEEGLGKCEGFSFIHEQREDKEEFKSWTNIISHPDSQDRSTHPGAMSRKATCCLSPEQNLSEANK